MEHVSYACKITPRTHQRTQIHTQKDTKISKNFTKISTQYEPINMELWVTFNRKES